MKTARECDVHGDNVTIRVGVQGRVVVGPAGSPGTVTIPLRYALVKEGIEPMVLWTKFFSFNVSIPSTNLNVPFTHIEEEMTVPIPKADELAAFVHVYRLRPGQPEGLGEAEGAPTADGAGEIAGTHYPWSSPGLSRRPPIIGARPCHMIGVAGTSPAMTHCDNLYGMTARAARPSIHLELRLEVADALGDQAVGSRAVGRLHGDLLRRGDGGVGGGGRTSASAWASACAILVSAILVRRATNSSTLLFASAARRSASIRAFSMIAWASFSASSRFF